MLRATESSKMSDEKKYWQLDVERIKTLKDVRAIFSGLNMRTWEGSPDWDVLRPYFTIPVQTDEQQQ